MLAAAVQLSSTPDRDRNLEAADRLTRAAAARGAELVVLPEKWPVLGTPEQTAAGAERLGPCRGLLRRAQHGPLLRQHDELGTGRGRLADEGVGRGEVALAVRG